MESGKEAFLSRWSRVKREALAEREGGAGKTPPPPSDPPHQAVVEAPLPPVEGLSFESDFTAFMKSRVVEEGVKRAALKKLFSDPRFNVQDGLDTYIDDYSIEDPIPPELLEKLQHVKRTLFGPEPEKPEADEQPVEVADAVAQPPAESPQTEEPKPDVDRG